MIYPIYALRDNKTNFVANLLIEQNDPSARRNFAYMVNNSGSIQNFAPADFDLFKIGTFDSVSGIISPIVPIEFICNGLGVLEDA